MCINIWNESPKKWRYVPPQRPIAFNTKVLEISGSKDLRHLRNSRHHPNVQTRQIQEVPTRQTRHHQGDRPDVKHHHVV
jgi:hypothetical protein